MKNTYDSFPDSTVMSLNDSQKLKYIPLTIIFGKASSHIQAGEISEQFVLFAGKINETIIHQNSCWFISD